MSNFINSDAVATDCDQESMQVSDILARITRSWGRRARVKRDEPEYFYNAETPDFLEELLPFCEHPLYQALDDATKCRILACGWIIYNEKTVAIELDIVSPACTDILYENIPGAEDDLSKEIVCKTLVDESYHLLLVKNANRVTREHRELQHIRVPKFSLVQKMHAEQNKYQAKWAPLLVRLSTAVVSEIFISDYLHQLSEEKTIQPMNRATVAAHRHDELLHSRIFNELTRNFYPALSSAQKSFFAEMLPKSIHWFANKEFDLWLDVLQQLNVPNADLIIRDCRNNEEIALGRIDYSGITKLAEDVGILDTYEGRSAFKRAQLI